MSEFIEWPKTARLFRDIVITEKIDGTNACVVIDDDLHVSAQSRTRALTDDLPDNYGFRAWCYQHAESLAALLGPGYHYGEWWGAGIQRRYGLTGDDKRFSLFNTHRWADLDGSEVPGLGVVPVLYRGPFDTTAVRVEMQTLEALGSFAMPGFRNPEGVVVYHEASRLIFKSTFEHDELPKSLVS